MLENLCSSIYVELGLLDFQAPLQVTDKACPD